MKSKGDKIVMACTHSTVIYDAHNSHPKRINDTSILSQRHTVMYIIGGLIVPAFSFRLSLSSPVYQVSCFVLYTWIRTQPAELPW